MKKRVLFLLTAALGFSPSMMGQVKVDVNMNVKHIVGGKSTFERDKYIILHATTDDGEWANEAMEDSFLVNYDVYLGRSNGTLPGGMRAIKEDPNKPGWPDIASIKAAGKQRIKKDANNPQKMKHADRNKTIFGGQNINYPTGDLIKPYHGGKPWKLASHEAAAEYYAHYIKESFTDGPSGSQRPEYIEVINEPFVKAKKMHTTKVELSKFHGVVANRVRELNPKVKVGGYTGAHPEFEAGTPTFRLWRDNWEQFIDNAGADMDFFSFHIYDGLKAKTTGLSYYRAGSNTEAMFDIIETYSKLKLHEVKPFIISEYGYFQPGIERDNYSQEFDWLNVRSFSTMMMQFMEKPDVIIKAIPFMILKANWWTPPKSHPNMRYEYRLLRQKNELAGQTSKEWEFTEYEKFFQLWSDVKGTRIDTKQSDIDIQVDAYVDGKKMYLILNNLEHSAQDIQLNLVDKKKNPIKNINVKHVYQVDSITTFTENTIPVSTKSVKLAREATMILEYTFAKKVSFIATNKESKIYADHYLEDIQAGKRHKFTFNTKELKKRKYGELVLRLGIGRDHSADGSFDYPKVYFNNTEVQVPKDWRGYDQRTRSRFFGVLEIPVPYELIDNKAAKNTVEVEFAKDGGTISSVVLQKFDFSKPIR